MGGRSAILTGLLAGVVVGGVVLGGLLLLPPPRESAAAATPSPEPPVPTATPVTQPSPSGAASPTSTPPTSTPPTSTPAAFGVGEPAPPLDVEQLGGGRIDLAALRGKPVWVNFMATWCPPCRDELPLMAGFAERYGDSGLVIVAVDVREDQSTIDAFARSLDVRLPVGLDVDGDAQRAWGAYALPVHFWIGADGVVRDGALGGIGPDVMAAGLATILPGVNVTAP
jgi:thiol-disulfide isomerase/thioredoxin